MTYFLELPHDLVHHIAFVMTLVLVQFPLGGVGSFRHMLGDIVQSSVIQMLDSDPHVFQAAGDLFMRGSMFTVRIMRNLPQLHLDPMGLTADILQSLSVSVVAGKFFLFHAQLLEQSLQLHDLRFATFRMMVLESLGFFQHLHGPAFQVCCFFLVSAFSEFGSFTLHGFGLFSEFI